MIGIFDSGVGGLTVVKKIFEFLPEYQVLYFGDTARTPYGGRGEEVIKKYALEDADFLIKNGAKIIVVACNTASAVAVDELRKKIPLPIFEVITPAAKAAVRLSLGSSPHQKLGSEPRIGVIATRATVNSKVYETSIRKLNQRIKVFTQPAPLLVPLVEEGWLKKPETKRIIKRYLAPLLAKRIDTLILGCTHYPFLRKIIRAKVGQKVNIIDPAEDLTKEIKDFLMENRKIEKTLIKGSEHKFYLSDLTPKFQELATQWLGKKIKLAQSSF